MTSSRTFSIYQSEYRIVNHLQSSLLPTIFNIFARNFAWVILMTSPMKHMTRKIFIYVDYFFENIGLCFAGLIILFKFLFVYFPLGLKFGMDPQKYIIPFYQNNFKIMLRLLSFQNQVAEIRVEYMGTQFLDPCSSPAH